MPYVCIFLKNILIFFSKKKKKIHSFWMFENKNKANVQTTSLRWYLDFTS